MNCCCQDANVVSSASDTLRTEGLIVATMSAIGSATAATFRAPVAAHARTVQNAFGAVACPASRAASGSCKQQLNPSSSLISRVQTAMSRRHSTAGRSATVRVQASGSGLKIDLNGETLHVAVEKLLKLAASTPPAHVPLSPCCAPQITSVQPPQCHAASPLHGHTDRQRQVVHVRIFHALLSVHAVPCRAAGKKAFIAGVADDQVWSRLHIGALRLLP